MCEMVTKIAVEITAIPVEELVQYGVLYNFTGEGNPTGNVFFSAGEGWNCANTTRSIIDSPGAFGITRGSGTPFVCKEMERHLHTEEAQIPLAEPICFCMAKAGDEIRREDVLPVILRPGYVFTLHRGTWHSSSHGLNRETEYQWLAWVYYNEPTVWKQVSDGPVAVKLSEC